MEITSVERSKKNKDRLSVFVDGKFSFTISEEEYLAMNLYDNPVITEEKIEYIKNTLNFREAKSQAVKYLSMKIRTEDEVLRKLQGEGYGNECSEQVVNELKAIGYINDKLYAQKYVFDRSKLKPLSKKLMKQELLMRGITEEIAEEVLGDYMVEDISVAESLLKRKFGKYDMTDEKIIKKATMFLMHRGFSYDIIKDALRDMTGSDSSFFY